MIIKFLEFLRIAGAVGGMFIAYYYGDTPEEALHIMTPILITAIAGLTGLEGLFFSSAGAKAAGFEVGSNYQRQSALAFLSLAIMSLIVYFASWGKMADLTITLTFLMVFVFSAINHTWQIIAEKNYSWKNLNRPFLTIALIFAYWWPVTGVLNL